MLKEPHRVSHLEASALDEIQQKRLYIQRIKVFLSSFRSIIRKNYKNLINKLKMHRPFARISIPPPSLSPKLTFNKTSNLALKKTRG